jgi:hypothetical protein
VVDSPVGILPDEKVDDAMKKGWVIGCSVAGVLGAALCGGVAFLIYSLVNGIIVMTQPLVDASNGFLDLVGQGKTAEAYASTSSGFRAQQDLATFTADVQNLGITDYASASWSSRNINNNNGTLEGTVKSKKGTTTPATIQLVFEEGTWKVAAVRFGGVDLTGFQPERPAQ